MNKLIIQKLVRLAVVKSCIIFYKHVRNVNCQHIHACLPGPFEAGLLRHSSPLSNISFPFIIQTV